MKLVKIAAGAMIIGSLGLGTATMGGAVASARPAVPVPLKPGHDCQPWCNGPGPKHDKGPKHWDNGPGHWDKGPWWAGNRHDWWDDRNGPPPWGWGPPPPLHWNGGPLPHSVNYWGFNANPVWDDGFRQWGIWLFGQWIPIFGVGFN